MNDLTILPAGTEVSLAGTTQEPIAATVLEANISGNVVSYKVAWWNGRCRSESWVASFEVSTPPPPKQVVIGFSRILESQ